MPRPKTKTKSEDLARIRDNQRRSRARRQEYIHELERRVREYEESVILGEERSQAALRRLQADNDALRQRIDLLSINPRLEGELTPNVFDTQSLWLPMTLTPSPANSELQTRTQPSCCSHETLNIEANNIDLLVTVDNSPPMIDSYQNHTIQTDFVMPHTAERDTGTLDPGESTTLCSLAYQWVIRCNQRGIDLHVISMWMQHGFQVGRSPLEGCRVDNRVLIDVLTHIS